jgi:putative ABC transport system ATP-binding protein
MDEPLIELCQVSKHFRKGPETIRAVDQVSLQVRRGDFIAIQGPSGSGKSTLLHLMGALDWPTTGQILLGGRDISRLGDRALSALRRERLGFVFQSFNLIPDLDTLHNVALPLKYAGVDRKERERRALAVLEAVGMTHRLAHRPGELSGGEEQRVAIARALVNRPAVILADEPTGNLDSHNREALLHLFADLHGRGQTIIVVTHNAEVAQAAMRQWQMRDGRLQSD